jgi:hypothetical protein
MILSVNIANNGSYKCIATNGGGAETSNIVTLTVLDLPEVTTDPVSQTIYTDKSVIFSVIAKGTAILTYQWYKNKSPISGEKEANLVLNDITTIAAGDYYCIVTNDGGQATSSSATLTVLETVTISLQPTSTEQYPSKTATFTIEASGAPTISYQWYKDSTIISGANSSTLSIIPVKDTDAGEYSCIVTNGGGSKTSDNATLTVLENVAITTNPIGLVVEGGSSATFSVEATGTTSHVMFIVSETTEIWTLAGA